MQQLRAPALKQTDLSRVTVLVDLDVNRLRHLREEYRLMIKIAFAHNALTDILFSIQWETVGDKVFQESGITEPHSKLPSCRNIASSIVCVRSLCRLEDAGAESPKILAAFDCATFLTIASIQLLYHADADSLFRNNKGLASSFGKLVSLLEDACNALTKKTSSMTSIALLRRVSDRISRTMNELHNLKEVLSKFDGTAEKRQASLDGFFTTTKAKATVASG